MADRSKLVAMKLRNLGCIGPDGLEVALDNIVCLVGRNNTGKSTVLRAYELAQGNAALAEQDRCQWTPQGEFPEVELIVHVPNGIQNVAEKWKQEYGELRLVRSRWQWKENGAKPVRQTWDPITNSWAEDEKAGGIDQVFGSRLPQPLRVGSLQDAIKEHDELLRLVTDPVAKELELLQDTPGSPLSLAIKAVVEAAMAPVDTFQNEIDTVAHKVDMGFKGVFPDLDIRIKVAMEPPNIDAATALKAGSSIRFLEPASDTALKQQGTGSRRALFWSLLQVRNIIEQDRRVKNERLVEAARLRKELEKEQKKGAKAKLEKINEYKEQIEALEGILGGLAENLALPGHILLIDEPENALHPMAVRAARDHLYALAQDPNWQVMLSTHSPYFINPLEDHTSILRVERDGKQTTARTFRTAVAKFSEEDRTNLRALLQLDTSLSEMFFGSYPIIVEGDTEMAAFIAAVLDEKDALGTQVTLVPARGKALIAPLVRLLTHFGIKFGVLHDTDAPMRTDGKKNGAWTENINIATAISQARTAGLAVRHQVSVPDFERRLGGGEEGRDKPIAMYRRVRESCELKGQVKQLFQDLLNGANHQPTATLEPAADTEKILAALRTAVEDWSDKAEPEDPRFKFPA